MILSEIWNSFAKFDIPVVVMDFTCVLIPMRTRNWACCSYLLPYWDMNCCCSLTTLQWNEEGNETWDEKIFHLESLSHSSSLLWLSMRISCQARCDPFSFKSFKDISTKSLDDDFYASPTFHLFLAFVTVDTKNVYKNAEEEMKGNW